MVSASFVVLVLVLAITAFIAVMIKGCCVAKNINQKSIDEFKSKYPRLSEGLNHNKGKLKRLIVVWKPLYLLR